MKYIYILLLLIPLQGSAQTINGIIKDDAGIAVEFANVILKKAEDPNILNVISSDINGAFQFDDLEFGSYAISVSMLGFEEQTLNTTLSSTTKDFLEFHLQSDAHVIEEIVVTSKRPKLIHKGGKTVVYLDHLGIGMNLSSALKKVPGLIISRSSIDVGASNPAKILINGRNTDYIDIETLLSEMPAENISKVEIIYQPDATYEANGSGPIINIILSKNKLLGTTGSLSGMIGNSDGLTHALGLNISSFYKNLNITGSLGYKQDRWTESTDIKRQISGVNYLQSSRYPYKPASINSSLDVDWYAHPKHTVGVNLSFVDNTEDWQGESSVQINSLNDEQLLVTQVDGIEDWKYIKINPYYDWKWGDKEESFLSLSARYVNYQPSDRFAFTRLNSSTIPYNNPITDQEGTNKTSSIKLDVQKEFTTYYLLKAGVQYDVAQLDNSLKNFSLNTDRGEIVSNINLDNHFLVDETIKALYIQQEFNKGKWHISGGLRWEDSNTKGTSLTINSSRERDIKKLFPNLSFTYQFNEILGANIAYSYRIERPNYNSLNPFVVFYDPLTTDSGNPNLVPEFTNSFQFNLQYEKQPFFRVEYKDTKSSLFEAVIQNDLTGETTRRTININSSKKFNSSLFFPLDFIPYITGYGGVSVTYWKDNASLPDFNYENSKWGGSWYNQIDVDLPAKVKLSTTFWIGTGALSGMLEADWYAGWNAELNRSFFDEKLALSFEIEDIIARGNIARINFQNINASVNNRVNFRAIYVRAKYKLFGKKIFENQSKEKQLSDGLERLQN